ncbi:hypothetical protein ACFQPA_19615 [Halomarina halobia]|uniref:Uncharacterized protein n=1 Tax=Halomarina halobia TaxID=3033386 RepID=A0ABD6AF13_9EURY|nr:hypothetical protein [Halomarina sp. PSR21]
MTSFHITDCADYDTFARSWHPHSLDRDDVSLATARDRGLITEDETRLFWQLLGQLASNELLFRVPEWLAEEKVGFVEGGTPTVFVGRIERETDKAILVVESAAARPLAKLAHRIHHLEEALETLSDADPERRTWLAQRLETARREFEQREDVTGLREGWLPKSQLRTVIRRV